MNAKTTAFTATGAALLTMASALLSAAPASAYTDPGARQKDKNLMRNLGIAAAAGAVYQATQGKTTNALILGAGAAYAGKKYEDARKAQSREAAARRNRSNRRYGWNRGR